MDKENNRPYARDGKPYVRDAGWAGRGPLGEAALSAAMVMLALAAGFAVGFLVWAVLSLANGLVALLWDALGKRGGEGFATPWFPLVVCTLGGLVIGVWTHFLQGAPAPLETVMASFKKTGSYRVEGAGRSVVGFLLPIVFGGSVGPEAGLTGLIASACCRLATFSSARVCAPERLEMQRSPRALRPYSALHWRASWQASKARLTKRPIRTNTSCAARRKRCCISARRSQRWAGLRHPLRFSEALADCLVSPSRRPGRSTDLVSSLHRLRVCARPCIRGVGCVVLAFVATCGRYCVRRYRKADGGGFYHGWNRCRFAQRAVFRRGPNSRACV